MLVTNKTKVDIEINGNALKPKESREYNEIVFDTLNIHSEIGSCLIVSE